MNCPKKFKIITKSHNFIYFVTRCDEDTEWHFNVGLKSATPERAYKWFSEIRG